MGPTTKYASRPFDNPVANTILRSSDGVDFRVHSIILAEASPFFSSMFSLPQPQPVVDSASSAANTSIIPIEEDSRTLDELLRLCYPVPDPQFLEPENIRPVLRAAMKYEMEEATAIMKRELRASVASKPLETWATACVLGLQSEAQYAAGLLPWEHRFPDQLPEIFNDLPVGPYYRLLKCSCAETACACSFLQPEDSATVPEPPSTSGSENIPTFTERAFADLVVRASDGVKFRTHKVILSTSSPALHKRILQIDGSSSSASGNPAGSSGQDVLPVLTLDVPSADLSIILALCYPERYGVYGGLKPLPLQRLITLTLCAQKHQIVYVGDILRAVWTQRVPDQPVLAYLLSEPTELVSFAEEALRKACKLDTRGGTYGFGWTPKRDPLSLGWFPEMEVTPARAYHKLMQRYATENVGWSPVTPRMVPSRAQDSFHGRGGGPRRR